MEEETKVAVDTTTDTPAETESTDVDYDAELTKLDAEEESRKENNRKGFKQRKGIEEDSEDTATTVAKMVEQKLAEAQVDDIIDQLSANPSEQKLIRAIYNTKIIKSGYSRSALKEDLELSYAIANRKKLVIENKELKTAVKNKPSSTSLGGGESGEGKESVTSKWTTEQLAYFKSKGIDPAKVQGNLAKYNEQPKVA